MILFHTDLDNTLIYSYKHDIGDNKLCVEIYRQKEISYITKETHRLLHDVKSKVTVVPTTTRTIEQYRRIDLGAGGFQYALVCNGGVLLVDGEEDDDWYRQSLEMITDSRGELQKALELLDKEERRSFELRFIKELFVFTKCEEAGTVVENLRKLLDVSTVDVFNNGVKVYVVPKALSKGNAVKRFRNYMKADYVIAAGDSEFDIPMLKAADFGIAATGLVQAKNIICPPADKLFAETMLEQVIYHINALALPEGD